MPPLPSDLRNKLDSAITKARAVATEAASQALRRLTVGEAKSADYLTPAEKALRSRLRAKAKQMGDERTTAGVQAIGRLTHEVAYEHWHRMLFARFLAENGLLRDPEHGGAATLDDCRELAEAEVASGGASGARVDRWTIAERFAAAMLPQIFRPDDATLAVQLAPEHRQALEKLLEDLPTLTFTADDSLGWVYQFWQSAEKERVNKGVKGGKKITGETLPAVTQLFTEHYMVLFLLHNTIGAWWAGRQMAKLPKGQLANWETEADARAAVTLPGYTFDYLRFVKDESTSAWRPAAGTFDGWPKTAKELKVLDPCCGSGHFLVAALELLAHLRMAEEGLSARDAAAAVIAENLYGLELDPRCTQIAAFNVALAAWKLAGEHFAIDEMHIACSGHGPSASLEQWLKLADKNSKAWTGIPTHARQAVTNGLTNLHRLFSQAPELGSLIDPAELGAGGELFSADWETLQPFLAAAMESERDEESHERAIAAQGMAKAAEILSGEYTLVITNVPYLGRGGQDQPLKLFSEKNYPEAKAALESVFISRIARWLSAGGTMGVVTKQEPLFLTSYRTFREKLLKERTWKMVARLGPGAFETITGHVVNVALLIISEPKPAKDAVIAGIDASAARAPSEKAVVLRGNAVETAVTCGNAATPSGTAAKAIVPRGGRTNGAADGALTATFGMNVATKSPNPGTYGINPAAKTPFAGTNGASRIISDPEVDPAESADVADTGDVGGEGVTADGTVRLVPQAEQLKNPDARIVFEMAGVVALLDKSAIASQGIPTSDGPMFIRVFWELTQDSTGWEFHQGSLLSTQGYGGREQVIFFENGEGQLRRLSAEQERDRRRDFQGSNAWGRAGVAVSLMGELTCTLYTGEKFDNNVAAIVPTNAELVPALWAYCTSPEFTLQVRSIDQKLNVTNATLVKVPFDLAHWQKVAAEMYPGGLSEPQSDDPTQWLFHGHPAKSDAPAILQVAVARLVGYRWPAELDAKMRLAPEARAWVENCNALEKFADDDGVIPLHATSREGSAADRLAALLAVAFQAGGQRLDTQALIQAAGSKAATLAQWLRDDFAAQHNALFHHRPFVWQIWDGKKDGFSVLVHYHRLAAPNGAGRKLLEKIAFTYLGDYIADCGSASKTGDATADSRRAAAAVLQGKLQAILNGEPPHDLFIRWKPLHEQPIGWEPDINDGVRMNIRPFIAADVVKGRINVKWGKDRGKEPLSIRPKEQFPWFWSFPGDAKEPPEDFAGGAAFDGVRWNDVHYSTKAKQAARANAGPQEAAS